MKEQKQVAIYARVSTLNGQDPTVQTRELKEYCKRRGWKIAGEYVDKGFSGATDSRPRLDQLMDDAHRRKFSALIVWKFDRFARSVSHLLSALEAFRALGIEFISLTEQLDSATPMGKMMFTILGSVAELERNLAVERVRAGMANAKAKGKHIGRPPLRNFSMDEINLIRHARREGRISIRQLAIRNGSTQFSIRKLLQV